MYFGVTIYFLITKWHFWSQLHILHLSHLDIVCELVFWCIFLSIRSCLSFTNELRCLKLYFTPNSSCFSRFHSSKQTSLPTMIEIAHCALLRLIGDPSCQLELYLEGISLAYNAFLVNIKTFMLLVSVPHISQASISQLSALRTLSGHRCYPLCILIGPCSLLITLTLLPSTQCILNEK